MKEIEKEFENQMQKESEKEDNMNKINEQIKEQNLIKYNKLEETIKNLKGEIEKINLSL